MLRANPSARAADNPGFRRMFERDRLTLGLFYPIESYARDEPSMRDQERLSQRAEALGFAALWSRDVPLRDPNFGDLGQVYDPWVWLGWIAAHTSEIALATGAIVLPVRHPLHVAKAAASIDRLSGGRFVMGVASGDRPIESPAFGVDPDIRAERFREDMTLIRLVLTREFPNYSSSQGSMSGTVDLVPKPIGALPILVTGSSRQPIEWIARNADGWITYPRSLSMQQEVAAKWRAAVDAAEPGAFKPFSQSLYIDLARDPASAPKAIHLGYRCGREFLLRFLETLRGIGVHHVILNLKYGQRPAGEVIEEIGREIVPRLSDSAPAELSGGLR